MRRVTVLGSVLFALVGLLVGGRTLGILAHEDIAQADAGFAGSWRVGVVGDPSGAVIPVLTTFAADGTVVNSGPSVLPATPRLQTPCSSAVPGTASGSAPARMRR